MKTGVLSLTVHTQYDVRYPNPARGIRVVQDHIWQGFDFTVRLPRNADTTAINARAAKLREAGVGVRFLTGPFGKKHVHLTGTTIQGAIGGILNQPGWTSLLTVGTIGLLGNQGPNEVVKPFADMVNKLILG